MITALVVLGAIVGAPLRYLTDRLVRSRHDNLFPWGTFVVNVASCLLFGVLAGAGSALPESVLALVGTGFCGALSTYSAFSYETFRLVERKAYFFAAANITVSVTAGLGATMLAYTVTRAFVV